MKIKFACNKSFCTIECMQFLFPEPITGVAPKVKDNEVGSIKKIVSRNQYAPLICAAQGFPSPKFRYLISIILFDGGLDFRKKKNTYLYFLMQFVFPPISFLQNQRVILHLKQWIKNTDFQYNSLTLMIPYTFCVKPLGTLCH